MTASTTRTRRRAQSAWRRDADARRRPRISALAPFARAAALLATLLAGLLASAPGAQAQFVPLTPGAAAEAPSIPAELTPDQVDGLLARLTDAEIRELLRQELARRADEMAAEEAARLSTLEALAARFETWSEAAERRYNFMLRNISGIGDRGEQIAGRLALAEFGLTAMIGAAAAIFFGACAAAFLVHIVTARWRRWLKDTDGRSYWDRVVRTLALTLIEFAPIAAFALAIELITPNVQYALGPLLSGGVNYIWIFEQGAISGWAAIVLSRRIFAPWAPQLRIANLSDEDSLGVHRMLRGAVFIGAGGWMLAGLWPTFGFGFGPAIATVSLAGFGVFALLAFETLRSRSIVRELVADAIAGRPFDSTDGDFAVATGAAAPAAPSAPAAATAPAAAAATPAPPAAASPIAPPVAPPAAPPVAPSPAEAAPEASAPDDASSPGASSPPPPPAAAAAARPAVETPPEAAPINAAPGGPDQAESGADAPTIDDHVIIEESEQAGVDEPDADPVETPPAKPGALGMILISAAPWLVTAYLLGAYLYWLARWFETGQSYSVGPVGTLIALLALPTLDSLGDELARNLVVRMKNAERFRNVLRGAWRVVLILATVVVVAQLWGLDLLALAKGPTAPAWASAGFDIAVTLLIGQLVWRLIQAALYQEKHVVGGDLEEMNDEAAGASRLNTLIPLFRIILLIVLVIVVLMIVLSSLGVDIGPLLASAGIIGIAIGFGAQTLVRDIFSGMFFLIDDAFRIGEYIELEGDLRGEVEALSIRSLQLRHHRGAVLTIPFGELKNVTNHSRDWVIYKMSFRLEPDTDPAFVKKIVKRIGAELIVDPLHGQKFLEPLKSQGVFQIDNDSALVMRVKFKAKPRMQFVLRREIYHRMRAAFAEAGIRFARTKVEVVSAEQAAQDAAAAAASSASAAGGDALQKANNAL